MTDGSRTWYESLAFSILRLQYKTVNLNHHTGNSALHEWSHGLRDLVASSPCTYLSYCRHINTWQLNSNAYRHNLSLSRWWWYVYFKRSSANLSDVTIISCIPAGKPLSPIKNHMNTWRMLSLGLWQHEKRSECPVWLFLSMD